MPSSFQRILFGAAAALALAGCASAPAVSSDGQDAVSSRPLKNIYDVSPAARATAVLDEDGRPVGLSAYDKPGEAVRAGDMAAFIEHVKRSRLDESEPGDFGVLVIAMDRLAAEDLHGARRTLAMSKGERASARLLSFVEGWTSAFEGAEQDGIDRMRAVGGRLPGLTGDLSLAAMLEAFGRHEEALAVYESLTPRKIEAPEHAFDPQGILFAHAQTVVSRRTLLLRRLGRIEEARDIYAKLAAAEPEKSASYDAALASLEDPEEFKEDEFLTPKTAFARSFSDLSLSLYQQRVITAALAGGRLSGFDETRSTMDQLALLIDPANEGLREIVIDGLYDEALYEGAAHVALSAPESTAQLELLAASAYLKLGDESAARAALNRSMRMADDRDRLSTLVGALRLYTLMDEERDAIATARMARAAAENESEAAATHALTASALQHFGRAREAVSHARSARDLDDTHDRRMMLADILGAAGEVDEALRLIRTERLGRPNDPYMLNTLGYFLITRTDRFEEGYKVLARAYALAERDPYIADSFGWARYKLGDLVGARRLLLQARAVLEPQAHWEIEDHLGDVFWHQGDLEEARAAWAKALEEYPPAHKRALIEEKLENGLTDPRPERRPLPDISLDEAEVDQQEI